MKYFVEIFIFISLYSLVASNPIVECAFKKQRTEEAKVFEVNFIFFKQK